ncbi:unnamed protein product, partial [Ectocarpus sp. 12 AP-2014]
PHCEAAVVVAITIIVITIRGAEVAQQDAGANPGAHTGAPRTAAGRVAAPAPATATSSALGRGRRGSSSTTGGAGGSRAHHAEQLLREGGQGARRSAPYSVIVSHRGNCSLGRQ